MRLRLLLFSHSGRLGGTEQVLLQLVRELIAAREVDCRVVVPEEGPLIPRLEAAGAEVWVQPSAWWCSRQPVPERDARRRLARGAASVLDGLPRAAAFDPDAVLSMSSVIPWGALAAALLGKPHVWYVTDFGPTNIEPPAYFFPAERLVRAIRQGSDRLVTVSEAVRERLFPTLDPPPAVVYPRVEIPTTATEGRAWHDPPRVTVFGNVRPSKGQWDAVAAVAELARRGTEAELVLVGPPEQAEKLASYARELGVEGRLRIAGLVPDQHEWIADTDIVLVPSHEETFSIVSLEALLHGKPLVTTRVGGIVEFVRDGVAALTVPARAPEALASALERLIRDPDLARRLAETGRAEARARFTPDRFSGALRAILDEVVAAGRRSSVPEELTEPLVALAEERREVAALRAELRRRNEELRQANERRTDRERDLSAAREQVRSLRADRERLRKARQEITSSRAWRVVQVYWRLVGRFSKRS